jgi:transcriptional regulator with XRE-family HTH domain
MKMGDRIKARRRELGLTLEDLGKALDVNRSTVKRYEDGSTQRIAGAKLELLAVALKTTPSFLMGWDEGTRQPEPAFDGEILLLAREMQQLPEDKRALLKDIVRTMVGKADEETKK